MKKGKKGKQEKTDVHFYVLDNPGNTHTHTHTHRLNRMKREFAIRYICVCVWLGSSLTTLE